jgi:F-box and leucine-rich repeat protein GRR1
LSENCQQLQGLNISGCTRISNESMIAVADQCNRLKRVSISLPSYLGYLLICVAQTQ